MPLGRSPSCRCPGPIDVPLPCPLSWPDPDRGRVRRARHRRHALDRERARELHVARRGRLPAVPQGLPADRAGRDPACAPLAVGPGAVELLSPPGLGARLPPRGAPDLDRPQARGADRLPRRALTLAIAHGKVTLRRLAKAPPGTYITARRIPEPPEPPCSSSARAPRCRRARPR